MFSHISSPAFSVSNVLDIVPSNKCVVIHHCFNFQFPNNSWCWVFPHMLICHLCIFFGEVSLRSFVHFKIRLLVCLLLSFKSSLWILDNNLLPDVSFAKISPVWMIPWLSHSWCYMCVTWLRSVYLLECVLEHEGVAVGSPIFILTNTWFWSSVSCQNSVSPSRASVLIVQALSPWPPRQTLEVTLEWALHVKWL